MQLTCKAFQHGHPIPSPYTCDGENTNPTLYISQVPPKTKSLALIMDDPDAPTGNLVHWLIWNLAPTTTQISKNTTPPQSSSGTNSFGHAKYSGPCPTSGTHRYLFKLYALDTKLGLPQGADKQALVKAMHQSVIEETILACTYTRR